MKKIFAIISLFILLLMSCNIPTVANATQTALSVPPTELPLPPTPDFTALLASGSNDIYFGPGENYPKSGSVGGGAVEIIGQAYNCAWLQVHVPLGDLQGWLKADQVTYTVGCGDVPVVEIPPVPQPTATFTRMPSATYTRIPTSTNTLVPTLKPSGGGVLPPSNSCNPASSMTIGNRTGSYAEFKLVGPGTFYISLAPDVNNIVNVCEGCYDVYIINGACGDASGSMVFRLCDGFNGWIYCG